MKNKKYLMEYIGTVIFLLFGYIVMYLNRRNVELSSSLQEQIFSRYFTPVALGLSYVLIYYCFAKKTGAHFNPAVSFAYFLNGKLIK